MLWLRQRDLDVLKFHDDKDLENLAEDIRDPGFGLVTPRLYDTIAALRVTKNELSIAKSSKLSHVFQCFQDLTTKSEQLTSHTHDFHIKYILTLLGVNISPRIRGGFGTEVRHFMVDNARLWFLVEDHFGVRVTRPTPYHLELFVRVMRWSLVNIDLEFEIPSSKSPNYRPFPVETLLYFAVVQNSEGLRKPIRDQWVNVLTDFFDVASRYRPPTDKIGRTLLTTTYLDDLLRTGFFLRSNVASFQQLKETVLPKIVRCFTENPEDNGLEYWLVSAAIILRHLNLWGGMTTQEKHLISPLLSAYNKRCNQEYVCRLVEYTCPDDRLVWPVDYIDASPSNTSQYPLRSLRQSGSRQAVLDFRTVSLHPIARHLSDHSENPEGLSEGLAKWMTRSLQLIGQLTFLPVYSARFDII